MRATGEGLPGGGKGRPRALALATMPPPALALAQLRQQRLGRSSAAPCCRAGTNGSGGFADDMAPMLRGFPFYNVQAIVRTWKLDLVTDALSAAGILGITVSEVSGVGQQGGTTERYKGSETGRFMDKTKLEVVVNAEQVEDVIAIIQHEAFTGEFGDGKLFIMPVADVVRIRTGERGRRAEKMSGGREDMLGLGSNTAHTP